MGVDTLGTATFAPRDCDVASKDKNRVLDHSNHAFTSLMLFLEAVIKLVTYSSHCHFKPANSS